MHKYVSVGTVSSGILAWLFGVTGPLLIVLSAAAQGNLEHTIITSWIFSIYVVGGLLTILLSVYYRKPIAFAFSIPGAVLVGTTLTHHSFSDVIGVYLVTGIVILLLGLFGVIEKIMKYLPMPIMMGMVSGVLLPFGIDIFLAISNDPLLNGLVFLVFFILTFFKQIAKRFPPILGAMIVATILLVYFNKVRIDDITFSVARPELYIPSFNIAAIGELALPLLLTVIAIQNAQGIGVLKGTGYTPPINAMTNWSGIGSIVNSFFGAHSACVAGPMTGILADKDTGPKEGRYTAAVIMGLLWIIFGIFAPVASTVTEAIPKTLIMLLGGLALIGVLKNCLEISFSSSFKMGALFSFMITMSNITIFYIGAPFWGLIGGTIISFLLEKDDFRKMIQKSSTIAS